MWSLSVFLAEPPATPYDLRFQLLGISVRVTPFFWVAAAVLGWDLAQGIHESVQRVANHPEFAPFAESDPGQGILLVIWVAAVFLSVLVHELGHAVVMRYYGIRAYIVLYHFGGLAVPEGVAGIGRLRRQSSSVEQIAISAAGPAAGLTLALLLIAALKLSGSAILFPVPYVDYVLPLDEGRQITSTPLQASIFFVILPCILWTLLNVLPVYPLDGGQIAREVLTLLKPRDGVRYSLILSVTAGAAVAIYAFLQNDTFLAIFFGLLAYSSYQLLQAYTGRGGFGGSW